MTELMAVIALWLSTNFGLPHSFEYPRIEMVQPAQLVALRYKAFLGNAPRDTANAGSLQNQREIVSVYDDTTRTIYLRSDWTGQDPAETSVLVHEMVHHLQNLWVWYG